MTTQERTFDFAMFQFLYVNFNFEHTEMTFTYVVHNLADSDHTYESMTDKNIIFTASFMLNSDIQYSEKHTILNRDQYHELREHFSNLRCDALTLLHEYLESDDYLKEHKHEKFGINLFHSDFDIEDYK